jgi:ArsR family transcriptional regulator
LEATVKEAAQFFKILAEEARLKILWLLFNHQELCVCDIMVALEITQSKASRHLSTLRHANLVIERKEGLWSYYTLRPVENELARGHLTLLKANLAQRPDAIRLLQKLEKWQQGKVGDQACPRDDGLLSKPSKTTKRTRRASLTGAAR